MVNKTAGPKLTADQTITRTLTVINHPPGVIPSVPAWNRYKRVADQIIRQLAEEGYEIVYKKKDV